MRRHRPRSGKSKSSHLIVSAVMAESLGRRSENRDHIRISDSEGIRGLVSDTVRATLSDLGINPGGHGQGQGRAKHGDFDTV